MIKLTTLVFAATFAVAAFAQVQYDAKQVEALRASAVAVHSGKIGTMDALATTVSPAGQPAGKILIWTDKKYYLPGEEVRIRGMGLVSDASQLQINIGIVTYDPKGNVIAQEFNPCECGDSNGGYVSSLSSTFLTLLSKKVPLAFGDRYDFTVVVNRVPASGQPGVLYQTTALTVYIGINTIQTNQVIRIDTLTQGMESGPVLFLTGKFPINVPLFYYVGAVPYEGAYSLQPVAISKDGVTLVLPGLYNGQGMEARVVLMTPDGAFCTTSPQSFAPSVG